MYVVVILYKFLIPCLSILLWRGALSRLIFNYLESSYVILYFLVSISTR